MTKQDRFAAVFAQLRNVLEPYAARLTVRHDAPDNFYLDTPVSPRYRKALFFGAVQVKKSYVSYYLMPVYMYPDLLDDVSPALRARMQGKSCFNFTSMSEPQVTELAALTARGFERMRQEAALPV
jgi:hypothetical protein